MGYEAVRKPVLGSANAAAAAADTAGADKSKNLRGMDYAAGEQAMAPTSAPTSAPTTPVVAPKARDASQEYELAEELYRAGDFTKALEHYAASLALEPSQSGPLSFNMGQCLRRMGRNAEAGDMYEAALASRDPNIAGATKEIEGLLAQVRGAAVKEAIAQPETEDAHDEKVFAAAEKAYASGAFLAALEGYMAVWSGGRLASDQKGDVAFDVAQCHRRMGSLVDASVWYKVALDKGLSGGPHEKEARALLAEVEGGLQAAIADPKAAEKAKAAKGTGKARQPVGEKPADPVAAAEAKFIEATDLYEHGYFDAAAELYVAIYHDPAMSAAIRGNIAYNLAQCFRQLGEVGPAVRWYQAALGYAEMQGHRAAIEEHLDKLRQTQAETPEPAPAGANAAAAATT
jgi:tetratricopeptide (TPR) repeat protein